MTKRHTQSQPENGMIEQFSSATVDHAGVSPLARRSSPAVFKIQGAYVSDKKEKVKKEIIVQALS